MPEQNDGSVPHSVTVKNVPVDGFWSITVYNAKGYMEENELGVYSFNNVTAEQNDDGSTTINFWRMRRRSGQLFANNRRLELRGSPVSAPARDHQWDVDLP